MGTINKRNQYCRDLHTEWRYVSCDFPGVEAFSHTNNPFIQMGYTTCMNFPCLLYCENIYHQKKPIHNEDLLVQICKEITYFFCKILLFTRFILCFCWDLCICIIFTPPSWCYKCLLSYHLFPSMLLFKESGALRPLPLF
jgi:hypothetical protein